MAYHVAEINFVVSGLVGTATGGIAGFDVNTRWTYIGSFLGFANGILVAFAAALICATYAIWIEPKDIATEWEPPRHFSWLFLTLMVISPFAASILSFWLVARLSG